MILEISKKIDTTSHTRLEISYDWESSTNSFITHYRVTCMLLKELFNTWKVYQEKVF